MPVGAKRIIDNETILISDQFLNKTLSNIKSNPKAAVTYWEGNEGYQLKGIVLYENSGERYLKTVQWVEDFGKRVGFPLKSKGVVIFRIQEIYGVSPGSGAGKKLA